MLSKNCYYCERVGWCILESRNLKPWPYFFQRENSQQWHAPPRTRIRQSTQNSPAVGPKTPGRESLEALNIKSTPLKFVDQIPVFSVAGWSVFFMLIQLDWFKGKWDNLDEGENRLFQSQKKHPNDPSNGELDGISHPNLFPKFGFWKIKKNVHLMPMKISLQTSVSEKKTSGWRLHQWLLLVPGYRENLKRSFKEAGSIRSVASWTASWGESSFADSLPSGYVKIVI